MGPGSINGLGSSSVPFASSSILCKNDFPVCWDSCRAISRSAKRSLCWVWPDSRSTIGSCGRSLIARSMSYLTIIHKAIFIGDEKDVRRFSHFRGVQAKGNYYLLHGSLYHGVNCAIECRQYYWWISSRDHQGLPVTEMTGAHAG